MTWIFHAVATQDRRLLSRVLQVFENQGVRIRFFASEVDGDSVHITCVISSEQDLGYRLQALLYRLENIVTVQVTEREPAAAPEQIGFAEWVRSR